MKEKGFKMGTVSEIYTIPLNTLGNY
ncbi:Protein of unknown function [Bacillus mycoides]|nr:Protein of unknown function [Bacillus mycoides]SCM89636.1 Protein of unknown function [Bacillus mycoides]